MENRKYAFSSVQIFFLIFSYVFSGLFIFAGDSFFAVVFSCFFIVAMCVAAWALCHGYSSSEGLYNASFGHAGYILRAAALIFAAYSLIASLKATSSDIVIFYGGGDITPVFIICAAVALFAVKDGFSGVGRFAELCFFAYSLIFLISLFGNGGYSFDYTLSGISIDRAFLCIGNSAVIFSLYLCNITRESEDMSDYARFDTFHPSPLFCGILGAIGAGIFYMFIRFTGFDNDNILLSFFVWVSALARIFAVFAAACELLSVPSCKKEKKHVRLSAFAIVFAAVLIISGYIPERWLIISSAVFTVLFPLAVVLSLLLHTERKNAGI
ncbi:MAG: hypothetical protein ACI4QR_05715 [Eubacteriales bacterium]